MRKCMDCKFFCNDLDTTCYKKHILNEFTGKWIYGNRTDMNSKGECNFFKQPIKLFGMRFI